MEKPKLIRVTTVPISLKVLLRGQLDFMREHGLEVIGVSSPGEELEETEKQEGIQVIALPMSRRVTPIHDLIALRKMYKLFKKEKPDIVHTHTPKAGIIGMLAARLAKVPVRMHTVAGLPLMEAGTVKKEMLRQVEKLTYSSATRVYPNSQGISKYILKEKLAPAKKLKVLGKGSSNGIDTQYFSPAVISDSQKAELRKSLGLKDKDFVFVFVGRLVKDKGINELVNAFLAISPHPTIKPGEVLPVEQEQESGLKLLLVGPEEKELDPIFPGTSRQIEEYPNIIATGFKEDVRPYLAIADVLVFPSYREGFPNVVMQAGAMGLPCIVTNINGCNEIIEEGLNGLIIPPKDVSALIRAMKKIHNDKKLRKQLASHARKMVVSRYEQKEVWEAILREYRESLK